MTRFHTFACAAFGMALVAAAPAPAQNAGMHGHSHAGPKGVEVAHGWARASAGPARAGAAYVTVHKGGAAADRLTGAESPVARKAMLHSHAMDGQIMRMRHVEEIDVPAGKEIVFRPGGYHIMLMGLKSPLKEGETFPLTLVFEKAGKKTLEIAVRGIAAMGPGASHDHSGQEGHGRTGR